MSDISDLAARPITRDDTDVVLRLAARDEERSTGVPSRLTTGDVGDWWQSVDLDQNSWLVTPASADPGTPPEPVGVIWLDLQGDELAVCFPIAAPTHLAAFPLLLDLVEHRAAQLHLRRLQAAVLQPNPPLQELLPDRGYAEVRRFYEMAIALEAAPPAVELPPGFSLHPVTPQDGRSFHATIEEAFRDHWEHHPLDFEEWWRRRTSDPEFDISWWHTVRDADQTVAAIRCIPGRNGGVYVASLGVRRQWRGRGLAKALLRHTFARAWADGVPRVTLGVDASSPTGATALYRGVGMTVELESVIWEKPITGSAP